MARFDVRHFLVPALSVRSSFSYDTARVCAIIPTYAPTELTLQLVEDLMRWNPQMAVCVVDDCTPPNTESTKLFGKIVSISPRVMLLRTPHNTLKAGALNYGLKAIFEKEHTPDVVLTLDDDVVIEEKTVKNLVTELMSSASLGAVCSECRVLNKNKNLLTRLQGLEYLGFNAIRLADEGFYRGPLVMHGMLTAFRAEALWGAGGFAEGHLIEDYEVTTRLKERGWSVKSAQNAPAWTLVPENLFRFWRQRTRWSYGGLTVVAKASHAALVFQDLLGHALFLSTLLMVVVLFFSKSSGYVPPYIAQWIIGLSFLQLVIWYAFQLSLMRLYEEKDAYDWALRIMLIPEFAYSYVMTLALLGSYIFHSFNVFTRTTIFRGNARTRGIADAGRRLFRVLGYAERSWGTRHIAHTL